MAKQTHVEEIWVSTSEGSEITGYNQGTLQKLARRMSRLPEGERTVKVRNRSGRHELWLPDLVRYMTEIGFGPYGKRQQQTT